MQPHTFVSKSNLFDFMASVVLPGFEDVTQSDFPGSPGKSDEIISKVDRHFCEIVGTVNITENLQKPIENVFLHNSALIPATELSSRLTMDTSSSFILA